MRCASPPESDAGLAVEREIAEADVEHEAEARRDLADDRLGDLRRLLRRGCRFSKNCLARSTVMRVTSWME